MLLGKQLTYDNARSKNVKEKRILEFITTIIAFYGNNN